MIMVVAGVQTDTAELVCTLRGHRFILAHREKRDQGGGKPLLLTKTERTSLDDITPWFLYTGWRLDAQALVLLISFGWLQHLEAFLAILQVGLQSL